MIRLRGITNHYANAFIKTFLGMLDEACAAAIPARNPEAGKRKKSHSEAT
jgi:hypothetical protein